MNRTALFAIPAVLDISMLLQYNGHVEILELVCLGIKGSLIIYFVSVEVLRPSQLNGVMSSIDSLPNNTFTGQA